MAIFKKNFYVSFLYFSAIIFCVFFLFPKSVLMHGAGASFEKEINNYIVDIGYDPEKPEVGESVKFDFDLLNKISGSAVSFSSVWVRIEKEGNTVFATGIHSPKFGKTGLLYSFPEGGLYDISTRFENNGEKITETSFPISIENSFEDKSFPVMPLVWGALGLVIGVFFGKLIKNK